MNNLLSRNLQDFLFPLFTALREAGMALTLDQYDDLCNAVDHAGHLGLGGWEDLKRICRLLWVKPSPNFDAQVFDQGFEQFALAYHIERPLPLSEVSTPVPLTKSQLPQIPPRRRLQPEQKGQDQMIAAAKVNAPVFSLQGRSRFSLQPVALPLNVQQIQQGWRSVKQAARLSCRGKQLEFDIRATLARIQRQGYLLDVDLRPTTRRRAELVLLIDDSDTMMPFRPALYPMLDAIRDHRVAPATIYRFTHFPQERLYRWEDPLWIEPLDQLKTHWHSDRTIILIWSDAGAATDSISPNRIEGFRYFFATISASIRHVIWLNPMPPQRWQYNDAQIIQELLQGQMLFFDPTCFYRASQHMALERILQP